MSRILRRHLFRGGPASSEGVGITSGLNNPRQGYADGPDDQGVQSYDESGSSIVNAQNPNYLGWTGSQDLLVDKYTKEIQDRFKKNEQEKPKEDVRIVQEKQKEPISLYDEYSNIIKKANLVDQDEIRKQKYLELAKFGLNLLKPTPAGVKPSLMGSIASAAEKPLEGYSNILTREAQAKQVPKQLALQATLNAMTPGTFEKNIQGLIRSGLSPQKALEFMTKEATYQQRAQDLKELDYYSEKLTNRFEFLKNKENIKKGLPDSASQSFLSWRKIDPNLNQGQISELPKDKDLAIDKKYYIDPNTGVIVRFDKKINNYRTAGEI
jgi:hypothetical protein